MTYIQEQYFSVITLLVFGGGLVVLFWVIQRLLTPSRIRKGDPNSIQDLSAFVAYECGEVPVGEAQTRFNFQYYVFALVFVVFDVITALLFPWALVVVNDLGANGMLAALSFLSVFMIGFAYWWKRDALRWM